MAAPDSIKVKVTKFGRLANWRMYFDDPVTGKRPSRSTKKTTEKEARVVAAKWEAELNEGRYRPKSKVSWQEFRDTFLTDYLRNAPKATYNAYVSALNALERQLPKIGKLAELTTARIKFAADKWRDDDGASEETVRAYLRHIQAALNWAAKDSVGMLTAAPAIEMPKRQKGDKRMKGRAITGEEFDRMLGKIEAGILACGIGKPVKNPKRKFGAAAMTRKREAQAAKANDNAPAWERLMRGLWLSGLRIGEAVTLSWDDESRITVELTGRRPMLRIPASQHKARRDTLLPMTPDFAAFLLQTPEDERTGPVFPLPGKRAGQLADANYAGRVISATGKAAGVVVDKGSGKFGSAHDLRRAFGERWAARVMPAVLMQLMRHQDISTTMKYYVGQNADAAADVVWNTVAPQQPAANVTA